MILVFGGKTGGLGQPLHQDLSTIYEGQSVVAVGRQQCDLQSEEDISGFLETVAQVLKGTLHIINATGVSVSTMIHKADINDVSRVLRVNVTANIMLLKHARKLYKHHGGTFTMLSSVAASDGPVGTAVYAASKAALHGLTRVAAKEFAGFDTRVNCLELGYFNRGMIDQVPNLQAVVDKIPLQTVGTVAALANACKFLIDCDYVTGAVIPVNGGL